VEDRDPRLPLPSEDEGDLVEEPTAGIADDPIVATEEGVPWEPPSERIVGEGTETEDQLEADDSIQATHALPRDDRLRGDVIEALRASDIVAGDRIRVAVGGSSVRLTGEVESVAVLDEILGIVGDVPGVEDVVDEVTIEGV
jgi:BON domain